MNRSSSLLAIGLAIWATAASVQGQTPTSTKPSEPSPTLPVDVYEDAGILMAKTPDGAFRWWLDSRMMLDSAVYAGSENRLANGAELRRGRVGIRMVFWHDWAAKFEVEYADNQAAVKDMWIAYIGAANSMIKIGQYTEPFCLDLLNSSRNITFIERGVVESFQPDRHLGVSYSRWGARWQASGGLFTQAVGEPDTSGEDQGYAWTGRFTTTPLRERRRLVHLGLAASYRTPRAAVDKALGDADQMRFRARPETHVNRGYFLDTGRMTGVDHSVHTGLEAAAVVGPVSMQGEFVTTKVTRGGGAAAPRFSGWYASASWFLTGESRPYESSAGDFGRVIPTGRRGAVEIAGRYSVMDLNDAGAGILGGKAGMATVGLNWYANANVRVMVDGLHVSTDQYAVGDRAYVPNDRFFALQARLSLQF